MRKSLPLGLKLVIFLQIIPVLLLPPATLASMGVVPWVVTVALFGLLGYNLWHRRAWSCIATVFVQGFSIIVRLLALVGHAVQGGQPGNPLDIEIVSTFILSMIISAIVLYYVDQPDVQLLMI